MTRSSGFVFEGVRGPEVGLAAIDITSWAEIVLGRVKCQLGKF